MGGLGLDCEWLAGGYERSGSGLQMVSRISVYGLSIIESVNSISRDADGPDMPYVYVIHY